MIDRSFLNFKERPIYYLKPTTPRFLHIVGFIGVLPSKTMLAIVIKKVSFGYGSRIISKKLVNVLKHTHFNKVYDTNGNFVGHSIEIDNNNYGEHTTTIVKPINKNHKFVNIQNNDKLGIFKSGYEYCIEKTT